MIICTNCSQQNLDGAIFCEVCGTDLQLEDIALAESTTTAPRYSSEPLYVTPSSLSSTVADISPFAPAEPEEIRPSPKERERVPESNPLDSRQDVHRTGLKEDTEDLPKSVPATKPLITLRLRNGTAFQFADKTEILIGRRDEVNNVLPDIDLLAHGAIQGGVSRRHARIKRREDDTWGIEDLGSINNTLLNTHRLFPNQLYTLRNGDLLQLGTIIIQVII